MEMAMARRDYDEGGFARGTRKVGSQEIEAEDKRW